MPKPIALDKPCETCGKNEWWDNTATKKTAKMPDFKCANKECRTESGYPQGRWLPKTDKKAPVPAQEPAGAPKGGRLTPDDTTPDERGERVFTWAALCYTYGKLYEQVAKVVAGHTEGPPDQSAIQAGVATLLIQGAQNHIPLMHPRKAEKVTVAQVAPKVQPKAEFEDFEEVEDDGSLPWP